MAPSNAGLRQLTVVDNGRRSHFPARRTNHENWIFDPESRTLLGPSHVELNHTLQSAGDCGSSWPTDSRQTATLHSPTGTIVENEMEHGIVNQGIPWRLQGLAKRWHWQTITYFPAESYMFMHSPILHTINQRSRTGEKEANYRPISTSGTDEQTLLVFFFLLLALAAGAKHAIAEFLQPAMQRFPE